MLIRKTLLGIIIGECLNVTIRRDLKREQGRTSPIQSRVVLGESAMSLWPVFYSVSPCVITGTEPLIIHFILEASVVQIAIVFTSDIQPLQPRFLGMLPSSVPLLVPEMVRGFTFILELCRAKISTALHPIHSFRCFFFFFERTAHSFRAVVPTTGTWLHSHKQWASAGVLKASFV